MLAAIEYAPLLRTKVAEVEGYRNLSSGVKDVIFPIFLVRPWPNASYLSKTVEKLEEAIEDRPFGLGLDRTRQGHDNARVAQREFDELFESTAGFRNYYDFVDSLDNAVPILQRSSNTDNVLLQLGRADELNRGLIIHFTREWSPPIFNIAGSVPPLPRDTTFLVDAGWGRDITSAMAWASGIVGRLDSAFAHPETISCVSSFPDSFSDITGAGFKPMIERQLFDQLQQAHNRANLTFGDWGSTRLEQEGGGGTIPPRIDVPRPDGWEIFRADDEAGEDYGDMANLAQTGGAFQAMPDCYGKRMIQATPGAAGVKGTAKATRARINMHLTLHSGAASTIDTNEQDYQD